MTTGAAQGPLRRQPATRTRTARAVAPEVSPADLGEQQIAVPEPVAPAPLQPPTREEIAKLAFLYWEERGCQGGSPEEDWLRAERELQMRSNVTA